MSREKVSLVMNFIVEDFKNMLVKAVMEDKDSFPYTCACIKFISDLNDKGEVIDFDTFDSLIVDKVYQELISFLAQ